MLFIIKCCQYQNHKQSYTDPKRTRVLLLHYIPFVFLEYPEKNVPFVHVLVLYLMCFYPQGVAYFTSVTFFHRRIIDILVI